MHSRFVVSCRAAGGAPEDQLHDAPSEHVRRSNACLRLAQVETANEMSASRTCQGWQG